ncbi:Ig-like and fibronectin type-III domain-containing protein 2, partial [Amphibalanus amphitrite]|uniref:Ig-like and fibronectin type-III domain-containing protein 2 n=1 Tax=Amphibalanus amphitrite TaxID=1232801 RepID=UPI001C909EF0
MKQGQRVSELGAATSSAIDSRESYDYTSCCQRHNVSDSCIGLCNLYGLHNGNQSEESDCEADFPHIIQCMADGRNHMPCCEEQGVPAMCSGICRGQYVTQRDSIKDHFSCVAFSSIMLNCVARGLDTLPSAPRNIQVSVKSLTELQVTWSRRRTNAPPPDLFTVNVTRLRRFDGNMLGLDVNGTELGVTQAQDTQLYNVTAERMFLVANSLQPLTMYEISVTAHNAAGSSLTSDRVRAVTWLSETYNSDVSLAPGLPDVRQCCEDSGVTEPRCLRQLCDPRVASDTVVTDVIICAPWAEKTFACMADGRDHSACCRARGLPQICVDLCAGNVTKIDFRYFRCLGFMGSYASCLMQGYGVVPSAPVDPRVALAESSFAVLRWNPPGTLADTVTSYTVVYRSSFPETENDTAYKTILDVHSPFLLGDLKADTDYEFYVEAVNQRGAGPQSSRVLFRTMPEKMLVQEATESSYNLSTCCMMAEMSLACLPLCHYNARMSTMKGLAHICAPEYHKLLRCSAGGRDHTACCERRGVPTNCLGACRGEGTLASECTPYLGNLWQCYEEGTGRLPAPVTGLHVTGVTNHSVMLIWEELEGNFTGFRVKYGIINAESRNKLGMEQLTT